VLVGSAVSALGAWLLAPVSTSTISAAVPLATLAAAREFGWISVPLVQAKRQTNPSWKVHGRRIAAVLWGFDLGLVVTTWSTFAGPWVLVVVAFVAREPTLGSGLFLAYWLGRALPVWLAPLLLQRTTTVGMMRQLSSHYRDLQLLHAGALLWIAILLLASALILGHS
jgi:cytochrome c biogenesis protein CcdA